MKISLLLLLFLSAVAAKSQETQPDCNAFHKGVFLYTDTAGQTWELKRAGNRQVEKNLATGKRIKYRIRWNTECEYRLTQVWSDMRERRKWNRMHFSYQIVYTTAERYDYTCVCKGSPSLRGTVVRQKVN